MIIWLASYPKSGNTYVRAFLSAYYFSENGQFDFSQILNIKQFPHEKYFKQKVNSISEASKQWMPIQREINQNKKTTVMDKVEIIFFKDEMKKIKVYADFGTLMNKNNDLSLEGNVKMLIQTDVIKKQISNNTVAKNPKLAIR